MSALLDLRARELMADSAIGTLDADETRELDRLASAGHTRDAESYELAAAAVHLAFLAESLTAMPESLRRRVADSAGAGPGDESSREPNET